MVGRRVVLLFGLFLLLACMYGQDSLVVRTYNNSMGVRGGFTSGLSFRHFFDSENRSVELIAGFWPDANGFTVLLEKFKGTEIKGLLWYYGGGMHYTDGNNRNYYTEREGRRILYKYPGSDYSYGFDGMLGTEYKLPKLPFILSMEVKPFFELGSNGDSFFYLDPALGLKVGF